MYVICVFLMWPSLPNTSGTLSPCGTVTNRTDDFVTPTKFRFLEIRENDAALRSQGRDPLPQEHFNAAVKVGAAMAHEMLFDIFGRRLHMITFETFLGEHEHRLKKGFCRK